MIVDKIKKIGRQLLPTGRAFYMPKGGYFDKLNTALATSEARFMDDALGLRYSLLADTDNFTEEDCIAWERRLGLFSPISGSPLQPRRDAILQKYAHPGDIPARQHYLYMQGQLQAAGFNVYVTENRIDNYPAGYSTILPESLFPLEGDEEIQNGSFLSASNWTLTGTGISITSGVLRFAGASVGARAEQTIDVLANSGSYRLRIYTSGLDKVTYSFRNAGSGTTLASDTLVGTDQTHIVDIDTTAWAFDADEFRIGWQDDDTGDVEYVSLVAIIPFSTYPGLEENYYGVEFTNYVVNHIDPSREIFWDFGSNLRATFFVGGEDIFNVDNQYADVPAYRVDELKQMILRIKPVQTKAFLLINET